MSMLESISDIVAIIRDVIIILGLIGMILGLVTVLAIASQFVTAAGDMGLVPALMTSAAGSGVMPGGIPGMPAGASGSMSGGSSASGATYAPDATTMQLFGEISEAGNAGDMTTTMQKLEELKMHFESNGWDDAAQLTEEMTQAFESGDQATAQAKANELMGLFGMEPQ